MISAAMRPNMPSAQSVASTVTWPPSVTRSVLVVRKSAIRGRQVSTEWEKIETYGGSCSK